MSLWEIFIIKIAIAYSLKDLLEMKLQTPREDT